jgi:DNA polymerase III delta prime subunit
LSDDGEIIELTRELRSLQTHTGLLRKDLFGYLRGQPKRILLAKLKISINDSERGHVRAKAIWYFRLLIGSIPDQLQELAGLAYNINSSITNSHSEKLASRVNWGSKHGLCQSYDAVRRDDKNGELLQIASTIARLLVNQPGSWPDPSLSDLESIIDELTSENSSPNRKSNDDGSRNKRTATKSMPPRPLPRYVLGAPQWANQWVERVGPTKHYESLRAKGINLICFTGPPGSGKSRTALQVALRERTNNRRYNAAIWLQAESEIQLQKNISQYFRAVGMVIPDSPAQTYSQFYDLLERNDARTIVVIDNVTDASLIDKILPPQIASSLVILTSENSLPDLDKGAQVPLGSMEAPEALRLARSLNPEEPIPELKVLCDLLGYQPLAIVHASSLIKGPIRLTIQQVAASIREDPAQVLKRPLKGHRALTSVYRELLEQMDQQDPETREVQALICCLHNTGIPLDVLQQIYASVRKTDGMSEKLAAVALNANVAILQEMNIAVLDSTRKTLHVNSLTHSLLGGLLSTECNKLRRIAHATVLEKLRAHNDGLISREEIWPWIRMAMVLVFGFKSTKRDRETFGIAETLDYLATSLMDAGMAELVGRWGYNVPFLQEALRVSKEESTSEIGDLADFLGSVKACLIVRIAVDKPDGSTEDLGSADSLLKVHYSDIDKNRLLRNFEKYPEVPPIHVDMSRGLRTVVLAGMIFEDFDLRQVLSIADSTLYGLPNIAVRRIQTMTEIASILVSRGRFRLAEEIYDDVFKRIKTVAKGDAQYRHLTEPWVLGRCRLGALTRNDSLILNDAYPDFDSIDRYDGFPSRLINYPRVFETAADVLCKIGRLRPFQSGDYFIPIFESYTNSMKQYLQCGRLDDATRVLIKKGIFECYAMGRYLDEQPSVIHDANDQFLKSIEQTLTKDHDAAVISQFFVGRTKLRLIEDRLTSEDYEISMRTAAFAANNSDIYSYAESLMIAYLVSQRINTSSTIKNESDRIYRMAKRSFARLKRPDRISLMTNGISSITDEMDLMLE